MHSQKTLIDLENDRLEPVGELCRDLLGKRISPATRWRWVKKGTRGGRLEAYCIAGIWMSTRAAFADFIRRNTAAAHSTGDAASSDERSEETTKRLQAAGLL